MEDAAGTARPCDASALDGAFAQLALEQVDGIVSAVVAVADRADLSSLQNVTEMVSTSSQPWSKDREKIALRIVKEFARIIIQATAAAMMKADNVQLFIHLDENLAPLLDFILAVIDKLPPSSDQELLRWTPFAIHASAFFCCGHLPAYDAMRCTELATRVLDACQARHQMASHQTLFGATFDRLVALASQGVSKQDWVHERSMAKHVLEWIAMQVSFPHFGGDVLGRVFALVFPLVDDLTDPTQLVGARMLLHIVRNVTATELRWYTDVLLEVLRGAITTRKPATLDCLVEALVLALDRLSPPGDFQFFDRFVPRLLNDCSLCSDVALRVVYTRHLRPVIQRLGAPHTLYLIRFLQPLLKVLVASFESVNGRLTIETLETLQLVVVSAWPRIPAHAEEIFVGVLKAVALCEAFQGTESHLPSTTERVEILKLSNDIVGLLLELDQSPIVSILERVAKESRVLKPFATRKLEGLT